MGEQLTVSYLLNDRSLRGAEDLIDDVGDRRKVSCNRNLVELLYELVNLDAVLASKGRNEIVSVLDRFDPLARAAVPGMRAPPVR